MTAAASDVTRRRGVFRNVFIPVLASLCLCDPFVDVTAPRRGGPRCAAPPQPPSSPPSPSRVASPRGGASARARVGPAPPPGRGGGVFNSPGGPRARRLAQCLHVLPHR